uniref:11-beta-hydroxysteroid dehydrogenase type 2 n=1 Tax=Arion vulgaris TaxID=1028688 RepID=A0A0B7B0L5_9EUPU
MELCAAVTGCYMALVLLAVFPRRVVKLSWRILQDILILVVCSFILPWLCCEIVACVVLTFIAIVMYNDLPSPWIGVNARAVVITGCDHGFGHDTALHLDKLGFHVFAGCLYMGAEGERKLVTSSSDRLQTFPMDVTNVQQVQEAAQFVTDRLQGKVLHGLINNAGILMTGSVETMAHSDIHKIIEVNCMGVINVHRAFMPLLRQPRRGLARQITVASNIGLAPSSLLGIYGASKAAVALLNETWRYELKPLGISVSTIIPSGFRTGILVYDREAVGNRWWQQATKEVQDYYGKACFVPTNKKKNYKDYLQPDFSSIINCITDALMSTHPKATYYKGLMARSLPFLYLHLPSCMWDLIMPHISSFYDFPVQALINDNTSASSKTS